MSLVVKNLPDEVLQKLMLIHSGLSPENLSGDGEIPLAQQRARKLELDARLFGLMAQHGLRQCDVEEDLVFEEFDRRQDLARRGQRSGMRMGMRV